MHPNGYGMGMERVWNRYGTVMEWVDEYEKGEETCTAIADRRHRY